MIQLNLLPDVKQQYLKARRRKRLVVGISVVSSGVCVAIFISLLIFVRGAQQQNLRDIDKDIASATETLKSKQDLDKILTIQNQLNSLSALHDQKMLSSRLFDYLTKLTPRKATVSDVTLDVTAGTINLKGNTDNLGTVNKFADTLKFTSFSTNEDVAEGQSTSCALGEVGLESQSQNETASFKCKAFSEVVLTSFSVGEEDSSLSGGKVAYELTFKYDPKILANFKPKDPSKQAIELIVPKIISTRSSTEKPGELFAPQPKIETESQE